MAISTLNSRNNDLEALKIVDLAYKRNSIFSAEKAKEELSPVCSIAWAYTSAHSRLRRKLPEAWTLLK